MKTATKAALLALVAILLPACASPLVLGKDYWVEQENRIIYGRTSDIVNEICFYRIGSFFKKKVIRWIDGCSDGKDDVLVLPMWSGPGHYIRIHEDKHRYDGDFHD